MIIMHGFILVLSVVAFLWAIDVHDHPHIRCDTKVNELRSKAKNVAGVACLIVALTLIAFLIEAVHLLGWWT